MVTLIASEQERHQLNSDNYWHWYQQGKWLDEQERYEEAIACYEKALAVRPDD